MVKRGCASKYPKKVQIQCTGLKREPMPLHASKVMYEPQLSPQKAWVPEDVRPSEGGECSKATQKAHKAAQQTYKVLRSTLAQHPRRPFRDLRYRWHNIVYDAFEDARIVPQ